MSEPLVLMRRLVPYLPVPLAVLAAGLAGSPWLRAFPLSVAGAPLLGAAALSVLVPVFAVGIGVRRLRYTALIDVAVLMAYELAITLRHLTGFAQLWTGFVHGPADLLSFASPLVGPPMLLVAPVALCWLGGAVLGECLARGWQSVLPYVTVLVVFGLGYAATAHAVLGGTARRYDCIVAGGLLLALLLLRAAQSWVADDDAARAARGAAQAGTTQGPAQAAQSDAALSLHSLAVGGLAALAIAGAATGAGELTAVDNPKAPTRTPSVDWSDPSSPLGLAANLRSEKPGQAVFRLATDRPSSPYLTLAGVDTYNGDGWTMDRTFLPSGGVFAADPAWPRRARQAPVRQDYVVSPGSPLTETPWMPFENQPVSTTRTVDANAASGMIVPRTPLAGGDAFTVRSVVSDTSFLRLPATAAPARFDPQYLQLPGTVRRPMARLVGTLQDETSVKPSTPMAFVQAAAREFVHTYRLIGGPPGATGSAPGAPGSASGASGSTSGPSTSPQRSPSASSAPTSNAGAGDQADRGGGTSFADVLTSVRQKRQASPEQYAALMCLIARAVGVPARLVSGFRYGNGASPLAAGSYVVHAKDAWTWVEIPVAGHGWVVLDAAPTSYARTTTPKNGGTDSALPSSSPAASVVTSPSAGNRRGGSSPVSVSAGYRGLDVLVGLAVLVAVAIVAIVMILLLRKRLRSRSRRHRGDPRRRLLGAWEESLDVLQEAGLPDLRALTSREVSSATYERFGDEPAGQARSLGEAANAAIFSPTTVIDGAQADAAWRTHTQLREGVRRRLRWRERVNAGLRYQRPARPERPARPARPARPTRQPERSPRHRAH